MAVVPVSTLRHVFWNAVGVGVRHPRRDVQHHIVGVPLGADVHAMNVQVERRGCQLLGIERHLVTFSDVSRIEEIADRQSAKGVLKVDDQRLARKNLQV